MATLYSQVENYVREGINNGRWAPGDVLPKEVELCEQFGVSRPTVRTALSKLVQEGYIQRIKRKGTVVREWRTLASSTLFIESFHKELEEEDVDVVTEVLDRRLTDAPEDVRKHLHLPTGAKMALLRRLCYARDSFAKGPVVLTTSYLNERIWPVLKDIDLEHVSLHAVTEQCDCKRVQMEKEITLHYLTVDEARILCESTGAPAFKVSTVSYDRHGRVVDWCESIYPPNRNKFTLCIRK